MQYIGALIVVEDIARSRHLYETLLKQKVKTDFGENVFFEGGFAIHQKAHFRTLIGRRGIKTKTNNCELYFESDDLESVQKAAKKIKLEFVHELREQPWRQRVLRLYDFDKHMIEIGERMEHVAYRLSKEGLGLKAISAITYLPIQAVRRAINRYREKKPPRRT